MSRKEALRPFGYLQGSRGGDVLGSNRGGGEEGRAPSLEWEGALEEGKGNGERKKRRRRRGNLSFHVVYMASFISVETTEAVGSFTLKVIFVSLVLIYSAFY